MSDAIVVREVKWTFAKRTSERIARTCKVTGHIIPAGSGWWTNGRGSVVCCDHMKEMRTSENERPLDYVPEPSFARWGDSF